MLWSGSALSTTLVGGILRGVLFVRAVRVLASRSRYLLDHETMLVPVLPAIQKTRLLLLL